MRRYEIPAHMAYHDGTRYHCVKIECFADGANLKEIARIPAGKPLTYTPILRCSECGATYFGLETRDLDAVEVIKQHAEKVKQAEEERAQNAKALAEMNAEAFAQEEERREQEQREEVYEHESTLAGDITIPNVIGEPKHAEPHNPSNDDSDIILPNILTV